MSWQSLRYIATKAGTSLTKTCPGAELNLQLKKAVLNKNFKEGLSALSSANQAGIALDEKTVLSLGLIIPPDLSLRRAFVDNVRIKDYIDPSLALLNLLVKSQVTRLANSMVFKKILDDTESGKNKRVAWLNVLIEGLGKQGDVSSVESILTLMRNSKLKPNHHTYGALMEAYSRGHQGDKVIELWYENPFKTPDNCQNQISILLDSCGFNNDLETLLRTWNSIQKDYYILNCNIYTSYIQALIRHEEYVKAVSTFAYDMCTRPNLKPDIKSYKLLVSSLQRSKLLQKSPAHQKLLLDEAHRAFILSQNRKP